MDPKDEKGGRGRTLCLYKVGPLCTIERLVELGEDLVPHVDGRLVENELERLGELLLDVSLNDVDHLLGLVGPALVGDQGDVLLEELVLVLVLPVRLLQLHLYNKERKRQSARGKEARLAKSESRLTLGTGDKRLLGLCSSLGDNVPKVVLLALERVEKLALEVADDRLVEVLDVAEEDGRERSVKVGDQVGPLALVHAGVIAGRIPVKVSWEERKQTFGSAQAC